MIPQLAHRTAQKSCGAAGGGRSLSAAEAAGRLCLCSSDVANERPWTGDRFCRALGGASG